MNVVVFGASGASGHELVRQGLALGHHVTAFVRQRSRLAVSHEHLRCVTGDVTDRAAVDRAIVGAAAVLVALGAKSPFMRDPRLVTGIKNITESMTENGVARLVYLSFAGAGGQVRGAFSLLLPLLSNLVKDHKAKEAIIMNSTLEWTIVRPALLTNGRHTGKIVPTGQMDRSFKKLLISRADVADFMLRQLTDRSFIGKSAMLGH